MCHQRSTQPKTRATGSRAQLLRSSHLPPGESFPPLLFDTEEVEGGMAEKCMATDAWWTSREEKGIDNGLLSRISAALENGADVAAKDANGSTPLHFAAAFKAGPDVIELLLKAGADLAATTRNKQQPLHWAAGKKASPGVVAKLLDNGADAQAEDSNERTPLHLAVTNSSGIDVISLLLSGGADVNAADIKSPPS